MNAESRSKSALQIGLETILVLALLVVPLCHVRALQEQTEPVKAAVAGLLGLALCSLAALGPGAGGRFPLALRLFLAWTLWQFAIAPFARSPVTALGSLLEAVESAALLLAAWFLLARPGPRRASLAMIVISGFIAAVYGLGQYSEVDPEAFPAGLATWLRGLRGLGPFGRFLAELDQTDAPGSFFGHANVAAEFVSVGALVSLTFALRVLLRGPRKPLALFGAGLALLISAVMVLFVLRSGSRAVLAGLAVGGALVWAHLVVAGARRAPLFGRAAAHLGCHLVAALVLLMGIFAGLGGLKTSPRSGQEVTTVVDRLKSAFDPQSTTVRERLDLWMNTVAMIQDRPVFGAGPGNFRIVYPEYADSRRRHELGRYGLRRQPVRPHNEYLSAFAETGLPGGLLLLGFLVAIILPVAWRFSALRRDEEEGEGVALAALAGFIAMLVAACFAFPFHQTGTRLVLLTLGAVLLRSLPASARTAGSQPLGRRPAIALACAALLLVSAAHHRAALKASADLRRISAASPDNPVAELDVDRALDQALARAPWRSDLQLLRAQFDAAAGRLSEAEAGFTRALAVHPSLANAWLGLARVRLEGAALEGARQALRTAVRLQPREPRVRIAAGDLYRSIGDRRAALREYEEALSLETSGPDRLVAQLALAGLHSDANRPTTAMHWLEQASTLAPDDPVVLEARARFFERHMSGSEATAAAWESLRRALPRHAEANLRCGQAEMRGARHEDALRSFEQAFLTDPRLLVALLERGAAQAALGRLGEARGTLIECMRRAVLPESRDPLVFEQARGLIEKIEARAREEGLMEVER